MATREDSFDSRGIGAYPDGQPAQYGATTATELIEPLFNDMFVRLFGSEKSRRMTRGMINAFLKRAGIEEIGEIDRIDAEYTDMGGSIDCKSARYDVRVMASDRLVDVEAQRFPEDIEGRSMFYAARMLASHTMKGRGYEDLPQVIVITLLDTKPYFLDNDEVISTCRMRWDEDTGLVEGTDRVMFVLVDVAKARTRYTGVEDALRSEDDAWIYLLARGFRCREEVDMIAEKFPTIEEFAQLYGFALDDPDIIRAYDLYDECWREEHSRQRYLARMEREAVENGTREGLAKGMEQGLARGMAQGMDLLSEQLRALGVDETLIKNAVSKAVARADLESVDLAAQNDSQ